MRRTFGGAASRSWRDRQVETDLAITRGNGIPAAQFTKPSLGPIVKTFTHNDIDDLDIYLDPSTVKITDCQYLASYSILPGTTAALVPGQPPRWTASPSGVKVAKDTGEYYRDTNAAHFPAYPLEPGVQSIFAMNPNYPAGEIDIYTSRNMIECLLHFIQKKIGDQDKSFRILVHVVGRTVFLSRYTSDPNEKIQGIVGYGNNYLKASLTYKGETRDAINYQRLVQYKFAGMKMIVRWGSDGYHPHLNSSLFTPSSLGLNPLSNPDAKDLTDSETSLHLKPAGEIISQSAVLDIKTRSALPYAKTAKDVLASEMPRLWITQTPNLVVARHKYGLFAPDEVHQFDARAAVQAWEKNSEAELEKLGALLKEIIVLEETDEQGCGTARPQRLGTDL